MCSLTIVQNGSGGQGEELQAGAMCLTGSPLGVLLMLSRPCREAACTVRSCREAACTVRPCREAACT
eukprot:115310-Chlamydomonas_euryale.AAC.1